MANANTNVYKGKTAVTDACTFIETVDEAKIIAVTSFTAANSPTIIVVYKT
jgi:hypothetical protein